MVGMACHGLEYQFESKPWEAKEIAHNNEVDMTQAGWLVLCHVAQRYAGGEITSCRATPECDTSHIDIVLVCTFMSLTGIHQYKTKQT